MKEVCGAISHKMDELKTLSGWNPFYIHVYILPYFHWSQIITVLDHCYNVLDKKFVRILF